jgi:hypothetical protein
MVRKQLMIAGECARNVGNEPYEAPLKGKAMHFKVENDPIFECGAVFSSC